MIVITSGGIPECGWGLGPPPASEAVYNVRGSRGKSPWDCRKKYKSVITNRNFYFDSSDQIALCCRIINVPLRHLEAPMVSPVICQICKQPVILETARIDERGKAVHEDCYLRAIQAQQRPHAEDDPEAGR